MSDVLHEERFICILISRFISLIFLSTLVPLNIMSLCQLFRDFKNFMSYLGHRGGTPTRFLELICPRYDPEWTEETDFGQLITSLSCDSENPL